MNSRLPISTLTLLILFLAGAVFAGSVSSVHAQGLGRLIQDARNNNGQQEASDQSDTEEPSPSPTPDDGESDPQDDEQPPTPSPVPSPSPPGTPPATPAPDPSPQPSPVVSPQPSPRPSPTPSPQPTLKPTPSPVPSPTPQPSPEPEKEQPKDEKKDDNNVGGAVAKTDSNPPPQPPEPEMTTDAEEILDSELNLSEADQEALQNAINPNVRNVTIQLPDGMNSMALQSEYDYSHGLPQPVNNALLTLSFSSLLSAAFLGRQELFERLRDLREGLLQFG